VQQPDDARAPIGADSVDEQVGKTLHHHHPKRRWCELWAFRRQQRLLAEQSCSTQDNVSKGDCSCGIFSPEPLSRIPQIRQRRWREDSWPRQGDERRAVSS
jgi:hypothetical protein